MPLCYKYALTLLILLLPLSVVKADEHNVRTNSAKANRLTINSQCYLMKVTLPYTNQGRDWDPISILRAHRTPDIMAYKNGQRLNGICLNALTCSFSFRSDRPFVEISIRDFDGPIKPAQIAGYSQCDLGQKQCMAGVARLDFSKIPCSQ